MVDNVDSHYDGHLIYEMPKSVHLLQTDDALHFCDRRSQTYKKLSPELVAYHMDLQKNPLNLPPDAWRKFNDGTIKFYENEKERALEGMRENELQRILELITEGRIKMSMLINSGGGSNVRMNLVGQAIDRINANSGSVYAYVGEMAASAAANILLRADQRYALDGSRIMYHAGRSAQLFEEDCITPDNVEKMRKEVQELANEIAELADLERKFDFIKLMLERAEEQPDDPEINLTGKEMFEFGVIHKVFETSEQMEKHVKESMGLGEFEQHEFFQNSSLSHP